MKYLAIALTILKLIKIYLDSKTSSNGLDNGRSPALLLALDVFEVLVVGVGHKEDSSATWERGNSENKKW